MVISVLPTEALKLRKFVTSRRQTDKSTYWPENIHKKGSRREDYYQFCRKQKTVR